MQTTGSSGWRFPFKPVKMTDGSFRSMDLSRYTMERKYDGWRAIVVAGSPDEMWTRDKVKIEIPDNLEAQIRDLRLLPGTILDGEIWNPLKRGSWRHDRKVRCKLTLWDVVRMGDRDVSSEPIEVRREMLSKLLGRVQEDVRQVEAVDATRGGYESVLEEAKSFREENAIRSGFVHGVVLKRRGSPRRDHATRCVEHPDWLKVVFPTVSGWAPRA